MPTRGHEEHASALSKVRSKLSGEQVRPDEMGRQRKFATVLVGLVLVSQRASVVNQNVDCFRARLNVTNEVHDRVEVTRVECHTEGFAR